MDHGINNSTNPTSIMNLSCNQNDNSGYPYYGQVHPSILASSSNISGEISALDLLDCGLSEAFMTNVSQQKQNFESPYKQARAMNTMYVPFTLCLFSIQKHDVDTVYANCSCNS